MQGLVTGEPRRHHHHLNNEVDIAVTHLKSCTSLLSLKQIHAHLLRSNLHHNNSLASTLLTLYSSFLPSSSSAHSLRVFSSVPSPSLSLFNHAIRVLSKTASSCPDVIRLYIRMTRENISPDNFTYPFLFNSCAAFSALQHGGEVHSRVVRAGFLGYLHVCNALVDMYGKCGELGLARRAFDEMRVRDVVSYNAVLGAHARRGEEMGVARRVFDGMPERNLISWNAVVVGYVNSGDLVSARAVFDVIPHRNMVSWNTMLVGYAKNGILDSARVLFDEMPERSLVSWAVMISGYAQNGRPHEALQLFQEMEAAGYTLDAATMIGVISSSAQLGGAELASWIGSYVDRKCIEKNERIVTALVDMHAKCGNVEQACRLFEEIPSKDMFSYTAIINGLASHGHGVKALEVFNRMEAEDIKPDGITFIGVLSSCSHAGLINEGLRFWDRMVNRYRIEPSSDHYACIIDMLGRAGRLKEAHELVRSMLSGPHAGALGALLAACRSYGEVDTAETIAEELFVLEPENTGNYMLLWHIYASRGQWAKAARLRQIMDEKAFKKIPGYSWV